MSAVRYVQNTQTQCEKHVDLFNVKPGGRYSNREVLKG